MFHSKTETPLRETELSLSSSASNRRIMENSSSTVLDRRTPPFTSQEPSLLDIIRIAALGLIHSSHHQSTIFQLPPYNKEVTLVQCLLNAAEEVDHCNYDQAIFLLDLCNSSSSKTSNNLTERLVYYFSQALCQRVRNKSGKHISNAPLSEENLEMGMKSCVEAVAGPSPILGVIYEKIPFYQVRQLAGVQAIVESVEKAKRIHIIDLRIRNGMQWTALMQALASRKKGALVVILKITAIAVTSDVENTVVETGKRLARFAKSMNIPFVFKTLAVPNMLEIRKKEFELDLREVVAIYCENSLHKLIQKPDQIEAFMGVVRNIRPKVMVVTEREANFNSTNFAHRFVEVLFHYGAYFDCIDACLGSDQGNKMVMESVFLRDQVNALLAKEGKEMTTTTTIDVWRKFFSRFWMAEARLSPTTMETVNLLLDRFSEGKFCNVDMNGRSMVVGWKETPIFSLSTWKFLLVKPLKRVNKKMKLGTCGGEN